MKFKGDRKYLFAVMDDETRFWIAQEVSAVKEGANANRESGNRGGGVG